MNALNFTCQMVAAACLLLAGKVEENHFNIRKLINVAYKYTVLTFTTTRNDK